MNTKKSNYKDEIGKWIVDGLVKKNSINFMSVAHDDWCDLLKNSSRECNCNPDINMSEIKEEK